MTSPNRFAVLENRGGDPTSYTNSERPWPVMGPKLHTRPSQHKWIAIKNYLQDNMEVYKELQVLRGEGWESEEVDAYFKRQRHVSDTADAKRQFSYFRMMVKIAEGMGEATGVFSPENCQSVLDLCMAPGGFTEHVLQQNFRCAVDATTLPMSKGGHRILLRTQRKRNVAVTYTDITLHSEFLPAGARIPDDSPDREEFEKNSPLPQMWKYNLVICDGQRLRNHEHGMLRKWEPLRLTLSEFILGLTHIKPGGSMVVLLHGVDHWDTVSMLYRFSKFSDIQLFKPKNAHRNRSSFYLIAKNVKPELAAPWVEHLKECWYKTTFGGENGLGGQIDIEEDLDVEVVLEEFGEQLMELGRDILTIQKEALESWDWSKNLVWVPNLAGADRQVRLGGGCPVDIQGAGHMAELIAGRVGAEV